MNTIQKQSGQTPSIERQFWRYTLPAVAGMLVNGLYATIDGIFIGQYVGANALASMNLVWPIFGLVVGIGLMCGTGSAALYSIFKGEGRPEQAQSIFGNAISLMTLLSVAIGLLLYHFGDRGLMLMGAKDDVLIMGRDYLQVISAGSLAALLGAALPMMIRNDDRPHLATIVMVVGAIANIVLDYLFIVVLQQGVTGAAIATVLAQLATAIIGLIYFFSSKAKLRLSLRHLKVSLDGYRQIIITGTPSLAMFLYMSFVLGVHNRLFLEFGSVTSLAAFTIVGYVQAIFYMMAEGIAHGIQPLVSYNHGAGNQKNIRKALMMGIRWVLIIGIGLLIMINLMPEVIARVFNNDDPVLIAETVKGLHLHLFTMFLDGFIVVAAAYFQALAKSKTATLITLGNMGVQIPLLFTLPFLLGVTGVWIALPLSNIFLAVVVAVVLVKDLKTRSTQPV
ncbi:MATE family efflux transporter [Endozoicomonas arenosclerae]|uniref:MATE family efflux transporter n=1 Tax=Endozoicomonas arenosclerae TaxID=1633495 RepID=UPI0015606146|nr:MATE family efflux transporter [Endozoicomonas arenosclerae]